MAIISVTLSLHKLYNIIKEDIILNTQEIYDNPTTRKLCLHIVDKEKNTTEGDHRKINLTPRSVAGKRKNNILLTGATGYLGIHILNELLKNSKSKIYCLIRKKDKYGLEERLVETYNYYFKKSIKNLINKRVFVIQIRTMILSVWIRRNISMTIIMNKFR